MHAIAACDERVWTSGGVGAAAALREWSPQGALHNNVELTAGRYARSHAACLLNHCSTGHVRDSQAQRRMVIVYSSRWSKAVCKVCKSEQGSPALSSRVHVSMAASTRAS